MPVGPPAAAAITFDFHNTVAHCDQWFQLETQTLIAEWLTWYGERHDRSIGPDLRESGTEAFRALRAEIKEHGEEMTASECVEVITRQLDVPTDLTEIDLGVDTLMRRTRAAAGPLPGVVDTVRQLAAAGIPLGIVSSAIYHPFLLWVLADIGLMDAFGIVTTSASAGFYKSRPEIYVHTLTALGADPAASIHVGDSYLYDIEGAHRAGMRSVWVPTAAAAAAMNGHEADLVLPSLVGAADSLLALLAS